MSTRDLEPGERIGDYVIEAGIDGGYLGVHVVLPRSAQLRVGAPGSSSMRVMREACILEALRVPGVPRVYEVGVLADVAGARPWAAIEIVGGPTLFELARAGRLPLREMLDLMRGVADILASAHARGVAHHAVRPESIVRGDRSRGHSLCLVNWSEASVSTCEDGARAYADDVFALGLVVDVLLATRAAAPPKLAALLDDMLAPDPAVRPTAAEVCARAKVMLEALDHNVEDEVVEEQVVLVDIISRTTTEAPTLARMRTRWTPAIPLPPVPTPARPFAPMKRRSE